MTKSVISTATNDALLNAVQAIQRANGWSKSELARQMGMEPRVYANWHAGRHLAGDALLSRIRPFLARHAKTG